MFSLVFFLLCCIGLMANGHVNASLPVFARPPPAVPAYSAPSTALATAPVAHVKLISDISDSRNVSNASARCLPQSLVIRQTENNTSSVPQPMIEKAAVEDEEDEDVEPSYPCGICHEEVQGIALAIFLSPYLTCCFYSVAKHSYSGCEPCVHRCGAHICAEERVTMYQYVLCVPPVHPCPCWALLHMFSVLSLLCASARYWMTMRPSCAKEAVRSGFIGSARA